MDKLSAAETTRALKKHIKTTFGFSPSVRVRHHTALDISYKGFLSSKRLKDALPNMQYGSFNAMEDLYEYNDSNAVLNDKFLHQFKWFFITREIPMDFIFECAKFVSLRSRINGMHECNTIEDLHECFTETFGGCWTWAEYIRKSLSDANFCTDQFDQIELLDVFDASSWRLGFLYAYNGKAYSTED